MEGFEPTHDGVKVHSLTTWRHPIIELYNKELFNFLLKIKISSLFGQEGIRTPDTVVRSHVL